jgi:hypothetical protein
MGDIKSSWEIARKKADALGNLSLEEQKKQRDKRCLPIGKLIADRFLAGQDMRKQEKELLKYDDEDRHCIRQMVINHLINALRLENSSILDRDISGILNLSKSNKVEKITIQIQEIFNEYRDMEKMEKNKIETVGRELLHQQRISGSAISMINIYAREEWQNKLNELALPFEERLNILKNDLLKRIVID